MSASFPAARKSWQTWRARYGPMRLPAAGLTMMRKDFTRASGTCGQPGRLVNRSLFTGEASSLACA